MYDDFWLYYTEKYNEMSIAIATSIIERILVRAACVRRRNEVAIILGRLYFSLLSSFSPAFC